MKVKIIEKKNVLQNIFEEKKVFYLLKKKFIKNLKKWKKYKLKAILDLNKKYGSLPANLIQLERV